MKNGIVILNYNDSENTSLFLKDIKNFKCLDHIIVVDNHSTDDSLNKLKKYETDKIEVIETLDNLGFAGGNNFGIRYLIQNYDVDNIIISNPDIIVKEDVLEKLLKDINDKNVAIVAPVIREPQRISRGWKLPGFGFLLLSNIPYFQRFANILVNYSQQHYETKLSQVDVVKGCFFIIKKDVILDINYFDENTFLYYEENILAKKLKDKKYKTYVDNECEVVHALSLSVDKSLVSLEKFKINKASQYYYEKNILRLNVFKLLILRITYYFYYMVAYILHLLGDKK